MAPMRVMSFNARMDTTQPDGSDGSDGTDAWPHRRALLLEDIAAQSPDLLGMQEVLPHMGTWLREQLEPAGYGFVGEPRGGDGTGEMMAVFYRSEASLSRSRSLSLSLSLSLVDCARHGSQNHASHCWILGTSGSARRRTSQALWDLTSAANGWRRGWSCAMASSVWRQPVGR